jgi:hypothetical protein
VLDDPRAVVVGPDRRAGAVHACVHLAMGGKVISCLPCLIVGRVTNEDSIQRRMKMTAPPVAVCTVAGRSRRPATGLRLGSSIWFSSLTALLGT